MYNRRAQARAGGGAQRAPARHGVRLRAMACARHAASLLPTLASESRIPRPGPIQLPVTGLADTHNIIIYNISVYKYITHNIIYIYNRVRLAPIQLPVAGRDREKMRAKPLVDSLRIFSREERIDCGFSIAARVRIFSRSCATPGQRCRRRARTHTHGRSPSALNIMVCVCVCVCVCARACVRA